MSALQSQAWGKGRAVLTLHQVSLQHGCFPNGILIQGTWLLIVFSSSRCNLLVVLFLSNLFKLPVTYMSLEPTNSPPIILQRLQTFLENGVNEAFGIETVGKVG